MGNWFFSSRELQEHRADQESLMTMTLSASAPGTSPTRDADGMDTTARIPKGSTAGRMSSSSGVSGRAYTQETQVGGTTRPIIQGGISIPVSAVTPEIGWEYVVEAVGPDDDPGLKGRRYRVVSVPMSSGATVRRLDVVEVPAS